MNYVLSVFTKTKQLRHKNISTRAACVKTFGVSFQHGAQRCAPRCGWAARSVAWRGAARTALPTLARGPCRCEDVPIGRASGDSLHSARLTRECKSLCTAVARQAVRSFCTRQIFFQSWWQKQKILLPTSCSALRELNPQPIADKVIALTILS